MSRQALERAIDAAPDDPAVYLVLADTLQSSGDPRGELIALHVAATPKARRKARSLLAEHRDAFLGPLARYPEGKYEGLQLKWRFGYIEAATVDHEGFGGKKIDAVRCLEELFAHPSARFLRRLDFHRVDRTRNDYRPVIAAIAAARRPTLRELWLNPLGGTSSNSETLGDLGPLWRACPNLETFDVEGNRATLGATRLPRLRSFKLESWTLDSPMAKAIASARWPALESLHFRGGSNATCSARDLETLLAAKHVPALSSLAIDEFPDMDALAAAIANSKLAAQLVNLRLALGDMTDAGARALGAGRFPKLRSLDVGYNGLTKHGRAAVAHLTADAKRGRQFKR